MEIEDLSREIEYFKIFSLFYLVNNLGKRKVFESAWDNFGKFTYQFQPETKTFIRELERIFIKLNRQNMSLLFNQTWLNEGLLPNYTYIYKLLYNP